MGQYSGWYVGLQCRQSQIWVQFLPLSIRFCMFVLNVLPIPARISCLFPHTFSISTVQIIELAEYYIGARNMQTNANAILTQKRTCFTVFFNVLTYVWKIKLISSQLVWFRKGRMQEMLSSLTTAGEKSIKMSVSHYIIKQRDNGFKSNDMMLHFNRTLFKPFFKTATLATQLKSWKLYREHSQAIPNII